LAVTYPARQKYDIKRGDSWDEVSRKSNGKCLSFHLPLLQTGQVSSVNQGLKDMPQDTQDVSKAYDHTYDIPPEERQQIIMSENGKQRFPHEGKACLERYRLASSRIFEVIRSKLEFMLGKGNFVMERASIDELFVDITRYCENSHGCSTVDLSSLDSAVTETVNVANVNVQENDPELVQSMKTGCYTAKLIRQNVYQQLGFTLSAGVSTCKLLAKLGASYGKPNGQAVIYPSAIPFVMSETEIRKCRNLGGKIGKAVIAQLPEGVCPKMENVRKLLSLPQLAAVLGSEAAQRVFYYCRGIDNEEVKETDRALVKSITAFKSFFQTSVESNDSVAWMALLASDVVTRVQQDLQRNNRYPKYCTIQYIFSINIGARSKSPDRMMKSLRIPFPKECDSEKASLLSKQAKEAIISREGKVFLYRIGLSATDFQSRMTKGGITSYFSNIATPLNSSNQDSKAYSLKRSVPKFESNGVSVSEADILADHEFLPDQNSCLLNDNENLNKSHPETASTLLSTESHVFSDISLLPGEELELTKCSHILYESEYQDLSTHASSETNPIVPALEGYASKACRPDLSLERDLDLARKLQHSYDREESLLAILDKKKPYSKRMKISNFFHKSVNHKAFR
jgi:nucleotidyltransferase/DNA polymerase involved in DNA repair